jgi:hypothetical protein
MFRNTGSVLEFYNNLWGLGTVSTALSAKGSFVTTVFKKVMLERK